MFQIFDDFIRFINKFLQSWIFFLNFTQFPHKFWMHFLLVLKEPRFDRLNQLSKCRRLLFLPIDNFVQSSSIKIESFIIVWILLYFSRTCSNRLLFKFLHSFSNVKLKILIVGFFIINNFTLIWSLTNVLILPLTRNDKVIRSLSWS